MTVWVVWVVDYDTQIAAIYDNMAAAYAHVATNTDLLITRPFEMFSDVSEYVAEQQRMEALREQAGREAVMLERERLGIKR